MWRVLNGEAVTPASCPKLFQVYSVRRAHSALLVPRAGVAPRVLCRASCLPGQRRTLS